MATIGDTALTLTDWAQRKDPDGKVAMIVELLNEMNPILDDMLVVEGNLPTGHRTTMRTGLPSATWRLLNYGVAQSKSRTVQVTDTAGMLEAYSLTDVSLLNLNDNSTAFRASEDVAFLEAMNQEIATTLFYGNTATDPEKFMGLAPRYNSLSAENGENIIPGGGAGADNTSIWLVGWGANTAHAFFPKGSNVGLQHRDLGEDTVQDANGNEYQAMRTHFKWDMGFSLRDWRAVKRIANVDVTKLNIGATGDSANLIDLMTQAVELNSGRTKMSKQVFYCNETIRSMLRRQINNKSNVNLTLEDYYGKKVVHFDGTPVQVCDAILNSEATVS